MATDSELFTIHTRPMLDSSDDDNANIIDSSITDFFSSNDCREKFDDYETKENHQLKIYGYLRNILNDEQNYADIISIIIEYLKQGYGQFFESDIDKDYKARMKFGDVVKMRKDNDDDSDLESSLADEMLCMMVLNLNNELVDAGWVEWITWEDKLEYDVWINIPYTICKHLTNATSFYSKIGQHKFVKDCDEYSLRLNVRRDDIWIINHFQGALLRQHPAIQIQFNNHQFYQVEVKFGDKCTKQFKTNDGFSYRDIEEFYESRLDKSKLNKIRVKYDDGEPRSWLSLLTPLPKLWSYHFGYDYPNYRWFDYIGPDNEQDMMSKIAEYYGSIMKSRNDVTITSINVEDGDVAVPCQTEN